LITEPDAMPEDAAASTISVPSQLHGDAEEPRRVPTQDETPLRIRYLKRLYPGDSLGIGYLGGVVAPQQYAGRAKSRLNEADDGCIVAAGVDVDVLQVLRWWARYIDPAFWVYL